MTQAVDISVPTNTQGVVDAALSLAPYITDVLCRQPGPLVGCRSPDNTLGTHGLHLDLLNNPVPDSGPPSAPVNSPSINPNGVLSFSNVAVQAFNEELFSTDPPLDPNLVS